MLAKVRRIRDHLLIAVGVVGALEWPERRRGAWGLRGLRGLNGNRRSVRRRPGGSNRPGDLPHRAGAVENILLASAEIVRVLF